jgi:hypothetical protein
MTPLASPERVPPRPLGVPLPRMIMLWLGLHTASQCGRGDRTPPREPPSGSCPLLPARPSVLGWPSNWPSACDQMFLHLKGLARKTRGVSPYGEIGNQMRLKNCDPSPHGPHPNPSSPFALTHMALWQRVHTVTFLRQSLQVPPHRGRISEGPAVATQWILTEGLSLRLSGGALE